MKFPENYPFLNKNIISDSDGVYKLVPIRYEDQQLIMKWRNEQIYHLRQKEPLTKEVQQNYFNTVVKDLFNHLQPSQILFSYLKNDVCIAYGGLVHINWIDKHAEISFVMDTQLEEASFEFHWEKYLSLIQKVAFEDLLLHKIFTYAFDLRPRLYEALSNASFYHEATLKEHCYFDNKFIDVLIHSKRTNVVLKKATIDDAKLIFDWANDTDVRQNALNQEPIIWDNHMTWFSNKINDQETEIYILYIDNIPVGQIRLDKLENTRLIDYSIDKAHRGKGIGTIIVKAIIDKHSSFTAVVKKENRASQKVFEKLNFNIESKKEGLITYSLEK